ncbi:DUF1127 domain-containing protein [Ensifer sp. MJa1]|uniref:DUF1127 domain-containing protein n=1 Tax=Ensifer sp. MJa1 TaxID=2919888 RepID=UPI00300B4BF6
MSATISTMRAGSRGTGRKLRALGASIARHFRRRAAIRQLHEQDDEVLSDIGLTRSGIEAAVAGRTRRR